jgi:glutamyl-tRNA synthetase
MSTAMYFVKDRAKTFPELLEKAHFALTRAHRSGCEGGEALDSVSRGILKSLTPRLQNASWTKEALEPILTEAPRAWHRVRQAGGTACGRHRREKAVTPSVYDMMLVIGRDETLPGWRTLRLPAPPGLLKPPQPGCRIATGRPCQGRPP